MSFTEWTLFPFSLICVLTCPVFFPSRAQVMSWSPCSPAYTGMSRGSSTYLLPWRIWFQMLSSPWQRRSSPQVRAVVWQGDDFHVSPSFKQSLSTVNGSRSADASLTRSRPRPEKFAGRLGLRKFGRHCGRQSHQTQPKKQSHQTQHFCAWTSLESPHS